MGLFHVPSWTDYGNHAYRQDQYVYGSKAAGLGALTGLGLTVPLLMAAQRKFPSVRNMHLSVKASLMVSAAIFGGVFAADKGGLRFGRANFSDQGKTVLTQAQIQQNQVWASLSPRDKAVTWLKEHKVFVVATGGLTSLALFFLYIQRQPMAAWQKLVQARVWAQGVTLSGALGMAGLSSIPNAGDELAKTRAQQEHESWKSLLYVQGVEDYLPPKSADA